MTNNEVIMLLRSYILSNTAIDKLSDYATDIRLSHDNSLSEELTDFLGTLMAMDAGPEFLLSENKMLNRLWDLLDMEQLKYAPVALSEIVSKAEHDFKFNSLKTLAFIKLFVIKLSGFNKLYTYDIIKQWFINPVKAEKSIVITL
jgi:hypothetical protein